MAVVFTGVTAGLDVLGFATLRMNWNGATGVFFWMVALLGMIAGWLGAARSEDRGAPGYGAREPH